MAAISRRVSRNRKLEDTFNGKQEAESKPELGRVLELSKSVFSDVLFPARLGLLTSPDSAVRWGPSVRMPEHVGTCLI